MSGCMEYLHFHFANGKQFSILGYMHRKVSMGIRTIHNSSAGCRCEVEVTADKVGMKMGLENIFDGCIPLPGELKDRLLRLLPHSQYNKRLH